MIKSLNIETTLRRILLIAACLLGLTMISFFVKWCFADAIAAHAPDREVAEWSTELAPNDPQTHYALAVLTEKNFAAEDLARAEAEYEYAVALAPNDYRLWLTLGKAREHGGDAAGAEIALRKASELAPNYAPVRWTLGNALLRGGKTDEAFAEITKAAEADPNYRLPALNTAWQIFDGNLEKVRRSLGDSASVNFALVSFLVKQKRITEAVQIWNNLPAELKKTVYKSDGEQLFTELLAAKKYRAAQQIQQDFSEPETGENPAVGAIFNGGFELPLAREKANFFDWQIADGIQPQIGPNTEQKHGGDTSLFFIFSSSDGKDFRQVSQIAAVEANKKYTLGYFYKSDLKTAATLAWEVDDAADGKVLAVGAPISSVADWTNANAEFTAAATTEAVIIRLVREKCPSIICPILGKVWFDDFQLR
ncbi:MAG: hypothetical protein M3T96_08940 [Acidobacteriota bacterium]|nr:hypothetical protein [Acidobacteriota bacterium]